VNGLALAVRLARRELRGGLRGLRVFLGCLAIGVAAIAGVGSVTAALEAGLAADSREILGGDVELRLRHRAATPAQAAHFRAAGALSVATAMRAMARAEDPARDNGRRLLVELKAVDGAYPLYGALALEPEATPAAALARAGDAWGAAVDEGVLRRLDLGVGDRLRIGEAVFQIRATVAGEPDRGSDAFALGPRVMVAAESLPATGLIRPGSQVTYRYRLRLPAGTDARGWLDDLAERFPEAGWRALSLRNATPGLTRFIERVALYLTLVGLTALLVGGVGVANAVKSYLDSRTETIATLKCLGAPGGLVFRTYLVQILALAMVGIAIGLAVGAALPILLQSLLADVVGVRARLAVYPLPLALAAGYGVLVALLFSLWPLALARAVPAAALFRALVAPAPARPGGATLAGIVLAALALSALAVFSAGDRGFALWFVAGAAGALALFNLGAGLTARLAARLGRAPRIIRGRPGLRLALANLHRPGAATTGVIVSLGIGLTVLAAIALVEANLSRQVADRMPARAPSFFFIDIQPDQAEAFDRLVARVPGVEELERVPHLRGRITRIDGVALADALIAPDAQWAVRSDRGLTYAATPPAGSRLVAGDWWPADYRGPPLISFDAHIAEGMGLAVGDSLTVNVLGRDVTATVASLRAIDWTSLAINFTIVFSPGVLEGAPHTYIATARTTPEAEPELERAVADTFANVSAIRVRDALDSAHRLLRRIGVAVRLTGAVTVLAGALVLAGAIAAGHRRRVYDAVVFKVLGATRGAVLRAFLVEYGLLGIATAVIGAVLGSAAAYVVVTQVMHAPWALIPAPVAVTAVGAVLVTLLVALMGTWRALGQKPAGHLRNE